MHDSPWFETEDEEDEPWDFSEDESVFVRALQTRAASWRVPWAYNSVQRMEDDSALLVHVSPSDRQRTTLGVWAVHFHGTHVRAGQVVDQLFSLDRIPELQATGPAEELADVCATWFETLLDRPVSRTEWLHMGQENASTWSFADSGEVLVASGPLFPSFDASAGGWSYLSPRTRHDRCTLVRGATQRQEGPHSPLCPFDPETADPHTHRNWPWPFGSRHKG
ncbi:hypothetical protein ACWGE1_14750 [Streptomyces sp. NPDC054932]